MPSDRTVATEDVVTALDAFDHYTLFPSAENAAIVHAKIEKLAQVQNTEALRTVIDTAAAILENNLPAAVRIDGALMVLKDA